MQNLQNAQFSEVLKWLETCPYTHFISSYQTGLLHIKIQLPGTLPATGNVIEKGDDQCP